MDDEKFDFPSEQFSSCLDMSSCSFDIDEFLGPTPACNEAVGWTEACTDVFGRTQACTHAHACHPSGPDKSHTHTCIHVHTQIMPTSSDVRVPSGDNAEWVGKAKKCPSGNREAVRKYREKRKARIAFLEDEVVRLRDLNQQLTKRLQGQDSLEAEVARLKCLLVDIRGRIEGEIGSFPYKKTTNNHDIYQSVANTNLFSSNVMAPCKMQCNDQIYCLGTGPKMDALNSKDLDGCVSDSLHSSGTHNSGQNMVSELGFGNVNGVSIGNASTNKRRRDGFTWPQRIKVALRFAILLKFLHAGNPRYNPYIVRNLDAAHILLEEDYNPKLCDLHWWDISRQNKDNRSGGPIRGCYGYIDERAACLGIWSDEQDVFAFGTILLSLISKRVYTEEDRVSEMPRVNEWAWDKYHANFTCPRKFND